MKNVPIKFRGKSEVTGKTIYGIGVKVFPDYSTMILDSLACEDVEENSVAQLVGYDINRNEVYEDDKLILGSHEYIAGIRPFSYTDDKKYYKPEKDFSDFLLKEV